MSQRKTLMWFLFNENKKPLYLDDNGQIVEGDDNWKKPDGTPAELEFAPEGWKNSLAKYARNIKYWGLFRDLTVDMRFVGDGYGILKKLLWRFGTEAYCLLHILKLNRDGLGYTYEPWYLSEINFSKFKQDKTGMTVSALEGGISKYLKANESTTYAIPISDDPQHVEVIMDGMELENKAKFSVTNGLGIGDEYGNHLVNIDLVQREVDKIGGIYSVPRTKLKSTLNTELRATGQFVFKATSDGDLAVNWSDIKLEVVYNGAPALNPAAQLQVVIRRVTEANFSDFQLTLLSRTYAQGITGLHTLDGQGSIPVRTGDELYFFCWVNPEGASGGAQCQFLWSGTEPTLDFEYTYKHPTTIVEGLTPYRVAEKLLDKMTGGGYQLRSTLLQKLNAEYVLLSGDSLRRIEHSELKLSWNDFFQTFFARESIGMGVDGDKLVIERLDTFFRNEVVLDLGEVQDCELVNADDLMFSKIKAGYEPQEYEEVNGKKEYNSLQEWATPITKIDSPKELDLVSPIRGDAFGIEVVRINLDGKTTTDKDSDNDAFLVSVRNNGQRYTLYRPPYSNVGGLLHPATAFNIELSPKRAILKNGAYIRSVLDLLDNKKLSLTNGDKNVELTTTLNGVTIAEKDDVQIGSLNKKLFRPYYFVFSCKVQQNLLEIIRQSPYGKVKFEYNDNVWYGFLVDGGVNPADRDKQTFKVLSCVENDLIKF